MASKDDRPGLLSKVAMFVRNPTKDWSELAAPADGASPASAYDKQALKAMVERKRQNDFVRKREFDQLRRLRRRDPAALASLERPSQFQNSLAGDTGARAETLKKIDEIEAQMSRQWWQSQGGKVVGGPTLPPPGATPLRQPPESGIAGPFERTQPAALQVDGEEFLATQMATQVATHMPTQLATRLPTQPDLLAGVSGLDAGAAPSSPQEQTPDIDPELEEGAIRFANSDDGGAEKGLLAALYGHPAHHAEASAWAAALLDLYRATHNATAFEAACQAFAAQLGYARPDWFALDAKGTTLPASLVPVARLWDSPRILTAADMENLRQAMASHPIPWHLGWDALAQVAPDAVGLLGALFASLCEEPVALQVQGQAQLLQALHALTPVDGFLVPPSCWQLRLDALRALGQQPAFERAAQDYGLAYGVAPPPWTPARCQVVLLAPLASDSLSGPATLPPEDPHTVQLRGQMVGDCAQALALLDATPADGQAVRVCCEALVRVDFAAAGSILNWATARHAAGCPVHFVGVQRLVAAFFHVIGIHECAQVELRSL